MENVKEVISPKQNAMFARRSIDNAVKLIYDGFIETVAEGKNMIILQTDFYKTSNYVNHKVFMELLVGLNALLQAFEVIFKVL